MKYVQKIFIISLMSMIHGFALQAEDRFIEMPYVYNFESPYTISKNDFHLLVGHRSSVPIRAEDNMLGLDAGLNLSLGIDYGLPYSSSFGIRRNSARRIYDFHVKTLVSDLLYKDKCPVNHALILSLSTPRSDGYQHDLKYNVQFLSSRLFLNKRLELMLPLYFTAFSNDTLNTTITTGNDHTASAGFGVRTLIIDGIYAIGEFVYPVWGYKNETYYLNNSDWLPYFGAAIQYSPIDGHNLELGISNASGMQQEEFIGGGDKDLRIGLTISIAFL